MEVTKVLVKESITKSALQAQQAPSKSLAYYNQRIEELQVGNHLIILSHADSVFFQILIFPHNS
jgi:hypothetical protein